MTSREEKIITVDLTDNIASGLKYGADVEKWMEFINTAKSQGYIRIEIGYENGYYDSVDIIIQGWRRETSEELSERRKKERSEAKRRKLDEKAYYEKLKAKFENKTIAL